MRILLTVLTASCVALASDGPNLTRVAAPLRAENIDIENRDSLLAALRSEKPYIASSAATMLSYSPKDERTTDELKSLLVRTDKEMVITAAGRALNQLGVTDWPASVLGRVFLMKDRILQMQFSAVLADAGVYEGWPLVREALRDSAIDDIGFTNTLILARSFRSMDGAQGKRLTIASELHDALQYLPPERQSAVWKEIADIQSDREVRGRPGVSEKSLVKNK